MSKTIKLSPGIQPNKQALTDRHNHWIKMYTEKFPEEVAVIKRLENKFGDYLCLPIDIPKIEVSKEFVDFYFENAKYAYKLRADAAGLIPVNQTADYSNKSTFLTMNSFSTTPDCIWTRNFHPDLFTTHKNILDQINEYFPIKSPLTHFSIWSSTANVDWHRDEASFLNLPTQFRVMLHNPSNSDDTTLRLNTHAPGEKNDNYFKIRTPIETNTMAWNNLRVFHGSKFKGFNKILFIPTRMSIDWKKYEEVIERSILKYKSLAFIDDYRTENYINE